MNSTDRALDLSIAQRHLVGFGLAGAFLVGLIAACWTLLSDISELRREQRDVVSPRAAAADELEVSILYKGLAARTYALTRDARHRDAFAQATARISARLDELRRLPHDSGEREALHGIVPLVEQLDRSARELMESGADEPLGVREAALSRAREQLLAPVRAYAAAQAEHTQRLQERIGDAVVKVRRTLTLMGLSVLALGIATAVWTSRGVRRPALTLVGAARALENGDDAPAVALARPPGERERTRDELAILSDAFGSMAKALRDREAALQASARVSGAVAASLDLERTCADALREIATHVRAEVGAVYVADESGALLPVATKALAAGAAELSANDGVPGDALRTQASVHVRDVPPETPFRVRLGIDDAPPRSIVAVPLVAAGRSSGVLVLGSLHQIGADATAFIEESCRRLAIAVQNAQAHAGLARAAAELQERGERLQAQNEEIQAQNEELQSQSEELQAQGEELQAQNEELRAQQEELAAQREELGVALEALRSRDVALQEADRRKDEFLAVLSHELRNPLAPIRNSLYILDRSAPASESARRAKSVIDRQIGHLARLVDDLLDVTRIARGKIHLHRAAVNLVQIVRDAAEDHRRAYEVSEVDLRVTAPERRLYVSGDGPRLAQVVGNLLQNALKFTPRGGSVDVTVDEEDGRAVIRVRDTGAGIDPATMRHLFQPFVQADATLARTRGGLGLGLALVKGLVEQHGGTVEGRSDGAGHGAEFIVRIPLDEQPAHAVASAPAETASARRVLVIEDSCDAAESLRDLLALHGHEVTVARDGDEGIEQARVLLPDVVLCDVGLPTIDGYAVAEALRADTRLDDTFLVALTGYARPDDMRRAREAGFDEHLSKPPSLEKLEEILAAAPLRRRSEGGSEREG